VAYGPDTGDINRRASAYVDRILRGERPGNLPVQSPIKFELVVNLKTAKALGLSPREPFLELCDEVIESGRDLLHCICLLLAQSGHYASEFQCPRLGVKRTLLRRASMSAFDP
jgi:hypothetical protein